MLRSRIPILINLLVILAAFVFGWLGWQAARHTSVMVEWTTASELDTVGFNVFRSEQPQGEYRQVNLELIPASPDPLTGGSYQYEDRNVQPGRTYYYQLEDVEQNGATTRHGPIEVKAEQGIWIKLQLLASGLLLVAGVTGIVLGFRQKKNDDQTSVVH